MKGILFVNIIGNNNQKKQHENHSLDLKVDFCPVQRRDGRLRKSTGASARQRTHKPTQPIAAVRFAGVAVTATAGRRCHRRCRRGGRGCHYQRFHVQQLGSTGSGQHSVVMRKCDSRFGSLRDRPPAGRRW